MAEDSRHLNPREAVTLLPPQTTPIDDAFLKRGHHRSQSMPPDTFSISDSATPHIHFRAAVAEATDNWSMTAGYGTGHESRMLGMCGVEHRQMTQETSFVGGDPGFCRIQSLRWE